MLEQLKEEVLIANLDLPKLGLVIFTWGNVSGIDRERGIVAIKPSGVDYDKLRRDDIVLVDLETGKTVEGDMRPSSDTPTHLALYRKFGALGGIVHTHSKWAVSFAQAGRAIEPMGTTHADYFYGAVPCTRQLTPEEVEEAYEANTGKVIIEAFEGTDPMAVPGVLARNHGPFTWGKDPAQAVYNSKVLEEVAFMNFHALMLSPDAPNAPQFLMDKHYNRKHGKNAYYGQK